MDTVERRSTSSRVRRLLLLVLATMASQAVLVVLAPTIVEIGREFGNSVGAVGQARSTLAGAAVASSLAIAPFLDRIGIRALLSWGAILAITGSAAAALSPSLVAFLSVHALIGVGLALLMSAGFAGVAAFPVEEPLPLLASVQAIHGAYAAPLRHRASRAAGERASRWQQPAHSRDLSFVRLCEPEPPEQALQARLRR